MGEVKQINIKNRTYCFYSDLINLKKVDVRLLKIDRNHTKTLAFTTLYISRRKKLMIVKILTVLILCIYLLAMQMDILKKKV